MMRRVFHAAFLATFALDAILGCTAVSAADNKPLRALVITGAGEHDWHAKTQRLRDILADSGRFEVRVNETSAGLSSATLSEFDVVIDNGANLAPAGEGDKAIAAFVKSGKGLVVAYPAIAAAKLLDCWPIATDAGTSAPVEFLNVTLVQLEHPIARGMRRDFRAPDSLPVGLAAKSGASVIATATRASAESGTSPTPVVVAASFGAGRAVALALGTDLSAMHETTYAAILARSCEWAATGHVTLPAELPAPGRAAGAVRALLVIGGHEHETEFYSIFGGYHDLDWINVDTSAGAFQHDLRKKYDVIIMYDFSRDLDDTCRQNLRDFVAADKGIVVLHHALLNYQKWNWWWEEVVGGRYRLDQEGSDPPSSVKLGQQIYVTPAEPHRVLTGVAPFHIVDEGYKNLWMSPHIRPLLTTDNPTSDHNLAWIGPCQTSRVVAIQLGHGHTAFDHPMYRTVVHNAILWAADKLK
jgi:type 1 glutamine amidotransferase